MNNPRLTDQCRKFLALPPYFQQSNIVCGDWYFYNSMVTEFGEEAVQTELKRLRRTEGDNIDKVYDLAWD